MLISEVTARSLVVFPAFCHNHASQSLLAHGIEKVATAVEEPTISQIPAFIYLLCTLHVKVKSDTFKMYYYSSVHINDISGK